MSDFLDEQDAMGAEWTKDEAYSKLQYEDEEGNLLPVEAVQVNEYAADMRHERHFGCPAEWHIAARLYEINFVVLDRHDGEDPEIRRYAVQDPNEPNEVCCEFAFIK